MKKFIYAFIMLIVIVPVLVFVMPKESNEVKYNTNTSTKAKMINTTVLISQSNKKKEEKEAEEKKRKEEEEEKKREEEEARQKEIKRLEKIEEEKKKKAAATTKAVTETEVISSRQQASNDSGQSQIGETKTITANSEKRVFEDTNGSGSAKFYDRNMSSYGTDCCASKAYKNDRISQGLTPFPSEEEKNKKTLAGVGLGVTSSGYQFKYKDIWFNAGSYGMVRMVASDYNFPIGTIVKIKDNNIGEEYKAIVLDRGDRNIGLDSKYIFDLVSETTIAARYYGIHRNIDVEVLHVGTRSDLKNIQNYGHL